MKTLSMYLGSIIGNNDTCIESLLDDEDLFYDHEKDIVIILDELRKQKLFAVSFRRDTEHFKLEYQPNTQTLQFFTDGGFTGEVYEFEKVVDIFKKYGFGLRKIYCNEDIEFHDSEYVKDIEIEFDWSIAFRNVKQVSNISVRTKNNLRNLPVYNDASSQNITTTYKNVKNLNKKTLRLIVGSTLPKIEGDNDIDVIEFNLNYIDKSTAKLISKLFNGYQGATYSTIKSFLSACNKFANKTPRLIDKDGSLWKDSLFDALGVNGVKIIDMYVIRGGFHLHVYVKNEQGSQCTYTYRG